MSFDPMSPNEEKPKGTCLTCGQETWYHRNMQAWYHTQPQGTYNFHQVVPKE